MFVTFVSGFVAASVFFVAWLLSKGRNKGKEVNREPM